MKVDDNIQRQADLLAKSFTTESLEDTICKNAIDSLVSQIEEFKMAAFQKRLKELNIQFNPEVDLMKRFKSFSREVRENREYIYYNDGSPNGRFIIGFELEYPNFEMNSGSPVEVKVNIYWFL